MPTDNGNGMAAMESALIFLLIFLMVSPTFCGKRELDDLKVDGEPLPVEEQIDAVSQRTS